MKQVGLRIMTVGLVLAFVGAVRAADQVWNDVSGNNTWSTNDLNWDAGVAWGNGNNAFFAGTGGLGKTVDISNAVSVVNITFQTSGYVIADADNNGMLTLAGGPSVVTVVGAGATGTVSEVLAGSGGLHREPNGLRRCNNRLRITRNKQAACTLNASGLLLSCGARLGGLCKPYGREAGKVGISGGRVGRGQRGASWGERCKALTHELQGGLVGCEGRDHHSLDDVQGCVALERLER